MNAANNPRLTFAYALKQGDMLLRQGNAPLIIASRPQDDFAMGDIVLTVHVYDLVNMKWSGATLELRVNILSQWKVATNEVRNAFGLPEYVN
jgi:hypothetical protein